MKAPLKAFLQSCGVLTLIAASASAACSRKGDATAAPASSSVAPVSSAVPTPSSKNGSTVEVKQDSPQAVVASIIKLYESGDHSKLGSLIDPMFQVREARATACADVRKKCEAIPDAETACMERRHKSCLCEKDGPGMRAAQQPLKYTDTHAHRSLTLLGLSRGSCKISSADLIASQSAASAWQSSFSCTTDVGPGEYARVEVDCAPNQAAQLVKGLLLQGRVMLDFLAKKSPSGDWILWGPVGVTDGLLDKLASSDAARAKAAKEEADLNKDMK